MERDLLGLALLPLIVFLLWMASLRRTPWAGVWAIVGIAYVALLTPAEVSVLLPRHHNDILDVTAITGLGFGCLPWACAAITESLALERSTENEIRDWRNGAYKRTKEYKKYHRNWHVKTIVQEERVSLYVERGEARRLIGRADPLADENAFMDVKAKAERAAETLNSLGI